MVNIILFLVSFLPNYPELFTQFPEVPLTVGSIMIDAMRMLLGGNALRGGAATKVERGIYSASAPDHAWGMRMFSGFQTLGR